MGFVEKSHLFCDLGDFDFLHLEGLWPSDGLPPLPVRSDEPQIGEHNWPCGVCFGVIVTGSCIDMKGIADAATRVAQRAVTGFLLNLAVRRVMEAIQVREFCCPAGSICQ
jgi:hypothetical protein